MTDARSGVGSPGFSRGVMYVHAAPAALCPHVEWAVSAAVGKDLSFSWAPQPASPGTFRAELPWEGRPGTAARITATLRRWDHLRFEVTEDAAPEADGQRFSCTPELGVFTATTNALGDVMISENQLRSARDSALRGETTLEAAVDALLGAAWDGELERFRHAGDEAPRLYKVG